MPPNLVSMHFTSTSTCMSFFSRFYFFDPHGLSPWFESEIWLNLKRSKISETGEASHAFHINFYLHECFEPILFFDPHGL